MTLARLTVSPPLPPGVYLRRPIAPLPFPLDDAACTLFARAGHALWHGLHDLGLGSGDEILVPAYHDGCEVHALVQAGVTCTFYDVSDSLEPDESALESLVGPRTRGLLLIHYLGFPQNGSRWRRWCDERDLLLIEDCAQAWLATEDGRSVGSFGHVAVFCFYKTFGLPDGAALVPGSARSGPLHAKLEVGALLRKHGSWAAARLPVRLPFPSRTWSVPPFVGDDTYALGDPPTGPAATSAFLLPRVADEVAAPRRRANFELLLEALSDAVPTQFAQLPGGASPYVFPLETSNKGALLDRLRRCGVEGLDVWPVAHPSLPQDAFPRSRSLRKRLVGLPVHQELRREDVDRIAEAARDRPSATPAIRVEYVRALDDLAVGWNELAEQSANIFGTWEWASSWWRHFGGRRELLVGVCRSSSGRLLAILPLHLATGMPVRIVRFVGYGPADQLGPVCAPGDRAAAARALRRTLRDAPWGWDVFFGEQLAVEEGWSALVGGKVVQRTASPVIRLGSGWEGFLSGLSSNTRQNVRRRERRLAKETSLRYRLASDQDRLQQDLDILFRLHRMRWPEGSRFLSQESFHRDFADKAFTRGWVRLWFLELDGRTVAAWYGFRFGSVEWYYQAGRDPSWDTASVGFVLLMHTIREAAQDGMHEYRLGRGGEDYKYRFAEQGSGLETIGLSRGLAGGLTLAAAPAFRRRRPQILETWYHA